MCSDPHNASAALSQVGAAATADLLAVERVPANLLRLIAAGEAMAAHAALEAAEDLDIAQSNIVDLHLKALDIQASAHRHWWVRHLGAKRLPHRGFRALLSDPVGAVVTAAANPLPEVATPAAVRLYRSATVENRRLILWELRRSADFWNRLSQKDACLEVEELYAQLLAVPGGPADPEEGGPAVVPGRDGGDLLRAPSEEIALLRPLLTPQEFANVAALHPDPIARVLALEGWASEGSTDDEALQRAAIRAADDEHAGVQLAAARLLGDMVAQLSDCPAPVIAALLALSTHKCLRVVQVAARGFREVCDTVPPQSPPLEAVGRLRDLLTHEDPLVRVNTLYALQDYYSVDEEFKRYLLGRWEEEREPRVRAAVGETLWWWTGREEELEEWMTSIGVPLMEIDSRRWRRLARDLWRSSMESAPGVARGVVQRVRSLPVRRALRLQLRAVEARSSENSYWQGPR